MCKPFLPGILKEMYHLLLGWLLVLHRAIKPKESRDRVPIALKGRYQSGPLCKQERAPDSSPRILSNLWLRDSPTRPGKKSFSRSRALPISSSSTSTSWSLFFPSARISQRSGPPGMTPAGGGEEARTQPMSCSRPWCPGNHHYFRICSSQVEVWRCAGSPVAQSGTGPAPSAWSCAAAAVTRVPSRPLHSPLAGFPAVGKGIDGPSYPPV